MLFLTHLFLTTTTSAPDYVPSPDGKSLQIQGKGSVNKEDVKDQPGISTFAYVAIDGPSIINESAFYNLNFEEIFVGDSVTSLRYGCFSYCTLLRKIRLSENLASLPEYCFQACFKLTTIYIPSSVKEIHSRTFSFTQGLDTFNVSRSNVDFTCDEGMNLLFTYDRETLVAVAGSFATVRVPSHVKVIGEWCFSQRLTERVEFEAESQLVEIQERAFHSCRLRSIAIPEGTRKLGSSLFDGSPTVSVALPSTIAECSASFLKGAASLERVDMEKNSSSLVIIEGTVYPSTMDSIYFIRRDSRSLFIPREVKALLYEQIRGAPGLVNVSVEENHSEFSVRNQLLYNGNGTVLLAVPGE